MRTYKVFWQGTSWVLSLPASICQSAGISKGDELCLKENGDKLIITNPSREYSVVRPREIEKDTYVVLVRVIGAEGAKGEYSHAQLGFILPKKVGERFANKEFTVKLEEKRGDKFKIVYQLAEN